MHADSSSLSILLGAHGLTGIEVKTLLICCRPATKAFDKKRSSRLSADAGGACRAYEDACV